MPLYKFFLAVTAFFGLAHLFRTSREPERPSAPAPAPAKAKADEKPAPKGRTVTDVPELVPYGESYRIQTTDRAYDLQVQIANDIGFSDATTARSDVPATHHQIEPKMIHGQWIRARFLDGDFIGAWSKRHQYVSGITEVPSRLEVRDTGAVAAADTKDPYQLHVAFGYDETFQDAWTVTAPEPARTHHVEAGINRSGWVRACFKAEDREDGPWSDPFEYHHYPPAEKRYPVRHSAELAIPEGPFTPGGENTLALKIKRFGNYPHGPWTERQADMIRDLQKLVAEKK